MAKRTKRKIWKRWLTLVVMTSSIGFVAGCQSTIPRKLDATKQIILRNERGFEDAYNASPEAKTFVQALMEKIINYEYELEKASLE
tara:strand:+ start:532 stop:789 length:258 start_codon:yes stop_codon:yes gene_type:complete